MNSKNRSITTRRFMILLAGFSSSLLLSSSLCLADKTITFTEFQDKLMGGWLGQGIGVSWSQETEFRYRHRMIPDNEVPNWSSNWINRMFYQDDNYCELPFVHCCLNEGVNAPTVKFGEYWKNEATFMLWCANVQALTNLNSGIQTPWSGHYTKHGSCEDIDWQIESNWSGMMCPGMPMASADVSFRAGHVMNYADGVYGGVFTAACQSAAYFASNITEIIEAGRTVIPVGSAYRQILDDLIGWHGQYTNWKDAWQALETKWGHFHRQRTSCIPDGIQAQLNGSYILMGLLYGDDEGSTPQQKFEAGTRISMQCGEDSDCNPSSTAAILGNWIGYEATETKWKSGLSMITNYSHTQDNFNDVIDMNCACAREAVIMSGGTVANEGAANETWTIPDQTTVPLILEALPGNNTANPNASTDGSYSQSAALMPSVPSVTITEDPAGVYTFTATATAAGGKTIGQYQWFFGDLSYESGQTVTHSYHTAGTYPVVCFVNDNTGITAWRDISHTAVVPSTQARDGIQLVRPESVHSVPEYYTIRGQRITPVQGKSPVDGLPYGVYIENAGGGVKAKRRGFLHSR